MTETLAELLATLPQVGEVSWIGVRPAKRASLVALEAAFARSGGGLDGDRYSGKSGSRHVTLIQEEHVVALSSLVGRPVDAAELRRNIVVRGINLLALKHRSFRVGGAVLEMTGLCHPCSRMEEILGPGGYNAMRGHGGITARIVTSGLISLGDQVAAIESAES